MRSAERAPALDRFRRRIGALLAAVRPPGRDRRRLESDGPPQLRAAGASTVYFDLYMKYRVGTLAEPLDTQTVIAKRTCSTIGGGQDRLPDAGHRRERAVRGQLSRTVDGCGVGSVPGQHPHHGEDPGRSWRPSVPARRPGAGRGQRLGGLVAPAGRLRRHRRRGLLQRTSAVPAGARRRQPAAARRAPPRDRQLHLYGHSLREARDHARLSRLLRAPAGARASSLRVPGSARSSGRRWPRNRSPGRYRSTRSGRGAGAPGAAARTIRTRKPRPASICGPARALSATLSRSRGRISTPPPARGRSSFRPERVASSLRHV